MIDNFSPIKIRPDKGHLIESVVLSNLIYSFNDQFQYCFLRTLKGAEVDFVLRKGKKIFPIEIKHRHFKKAKIERGFRNFLKFYQPRTAFECKPSSLAAMEMGGVPLTISIEEIWYLQSSFLQGTILICLPIDLREQPKRNSISTSIIEELRVELFSMITVILIPF